MEAKREAIRFLFDVNPNKARTKRMANCVNHHQFGGHRNLDMFIKPL